MMPHKWKGEITSSIKWYLLFFSLSTLFELKYATIHDNTFEEAFSLLITY